MDVFALSNSAWKTFALPQITGKIFTDDAASRHLEICAE